MAIHQLKNLKSAYPAGQYWSSLAGLNLKIINLSAINAFTKSGEKAMIMAKWDNAARAAFINSTEDMIVETIETAVNRGCLPIKCSSPEIRNMIILVLIELFRRWQAGICCDRGLMQCKVCKGKGMIEPAKLKWVEGAEEVFKIINRAEVYKMRIEVNQYREDLAKLREEDPLE